MTQPGLYRWQDQGLFCVVLILFACVVQPCWAQEPSADAQLSRAEKIVFGNSNAGKPIEPRLSALESSLIGKQPPGSSIKNRMAAVNKVLGIRPTSAPISKTPLAKPTPGAAQVASLPPVAPKAVMSTKELLQIGTCKFSQGDRLGADAAFRKVLVSDPNNVDALYNLGAISERRGDLVSALGLYKSALKSKPSDREIQEAVSSVETQFSGRHAATKPLIGGAEMQQLGGNVQLSEQIPQVAPQRCTMYGSVNNNAIAQNRTGGYPILSVQTPQFQQQQATQQAQQKRSAGGHALIGVLHMGIGRLPYVGGMSCPLCEMLNSKF